MLLPQFITRFCVRLGLTLLLVFILPALAHLGVWSFGDRPASWRQASWSSSGMLPQNPSADHAEIYVLSARTGGLKGAFATHSWLVLKPQGAARFDRYEVVGWGNPVRKNAYDADAFWYSNAPTIDHHIVGAEAARLLPKLEKAIENYRWRNRGDYTLWPGPNSNTFVANILDQVSGHLASTPSTAVGRDFPADGRWIGRRTDGAYFATIGGYLGIVIGGTTGLELNFLGLVAGINPNKAEIKIPAFGGYRFFQ